MQFIFCVIMVFSIPGRSQHSETFIENGISLVFINEDPAFNPQVKEGLVKAFFSVYPKLLKTFNPEALKELEVKIDTAYDGVAYAHQRKITISSEWLKNKPEDIDVITHEAMHIIQSYPRNSGPGWLTEGVADYARYLYGVNNNGAGWSLPEYSSENHYTQSYRVTARFLLWITRHYQENLVVKLDEHLREKTYKADFWEKYTGKSLDELWEMYSKSPNIS